MARGVGGQSPANVQKFLSGVDYPASKDDLIKKAKQNSAPSDVMKLIKDLPLDQFGGPQDVMKAYGQLK